MSRSIIVVALVVLWSQAARAEPAENLARELSRLRAETETLSERIGRELDDRRIRLRGLAEQQSVAEGERRREAQRRDELVARVASQKKNLAELSQRESALEPAVRDAIVVLEGAIAASLPYRLADRLATVETLGQSLTNKTAIPSQVFGRLWELAEDELRLGREVALDRQVVGLTDGERLVDVLRVGMVLLYFKTPDGRLGQAVQRDGKWIFDVFPNEAERERLTEVFGSFERRVTSGFFSLPLLPGGLR